MRTSMCSGRSHATLCLSGVGAVAINPVLYTNLSYDMQRDFAPVSLVVDNDELLPRVQKLETDAVKQKPQSRNIFAM
jgi:hypothetical protein